MIDFAPRFRRPARLPALRVSPSLARESFAVPVALVVLTCVGAIAIVNRLRPDDRVQATGFASPDYAGYLSDLSGAPFPATLSAAWDTSAPSRGLSRHARSVRVGARIVDLEVAVRARDMLSSAALVNRDSTSILTYHDQSALAARFAGDIASMLAAADGLRYLADDFKRIQRMASEPSTLGGEVRRARRVAVADDAPYLLLGDWLEAARIAAARDDGAFFARRESIVQMEKQRSMRGLDASSRAALDRVRRVMSIGKVGNFDALRGALDTALARLAIAR